MKENDEELVDLDEEGKIKDENNKEQKPKKKNYTFAILASIIVICIIICAGILTVKFYKKTNHIELIIANDYDEMSLKAANIIADLIKKNPNAILGLATGSTPIGTYNELPTSNNYIILYYTH